ncbi:hypothetical protein D3248_09640 [Leucobacter zeae]|nr:hypothetical protein [Leucobacter zeae]
MRRAKPLSLLAIAIAGALGLIAGSQTWVSFMLDGTHDLEAVTGHAVNAALSPVSIALVAAALALTIAGPVFRRILGGLVALLGAGLVALSASVVASPIAAVGARITELTGIAGDVAGDLVVWHSVAAWAWVSIAAGALAVLAGALVIVLGGRWAAGGRKYDASAQRAPAGAGSDRISDWDALSEGGDPTSSD